ncbi:MAG TPA: phosphotransferase [Acidimicrobiales bacterium]|nr:phosphotransferase [Acidimicrobiales bacterium]
MSDAVSSIGTTDRPAGARPEPAVVDDAGQLTPAWFDAALGTAGTPAAVRAVTTEAVGTGQMASTVRAHLTLAGGGDRTVIVKYARADVASEMARMAYAKEVSFYAELGDRVAIRTPDCLYAAMADGEPRFVLVLEDMAGARPGDQIAGCPVEHAEAALVNLAGLHGPTWRDETLRSAAWLGGDAEVSAEMLTPFLAVAADGFAARFADDLDADEQAVLAASRELLAAWMTARPERFAVIHGDYRLDNLLFPHDDPAGVSAVDWQTASLGRPAADVAFFLSTCLEVDDRRRHERDLVAAYHRALGDHDIGEYDVEDCWEDYRLAMLHGPLIILLGRLTATVTERGDEMFRTMWRRSSAAITDLDSLAAIRAEIAATG